MYRYFLTVLAASIFHFPVQKTLRKRQQQTLFEIHAGQAIMKISAMGGRIVSFSLDSVEILSTKNENANFGSTLWTAPQSDWGWPPYPVLDSMRYQVEKNGDTIEMISAPDLKSGLQFEKKWSVSNNSSICINYLIRNITSKAISIGAWEVTRVPCGGLSFFPGGSDEMIPKSSLQITGKKNGIYWTDINKLPGKAHQKLFATASGGWQAYAYNGLLLIKQFPDISIAQYSPGQGEIEIYIDKNKSYTELENHGAYTELKPGGTLSYEVNWYLRRIPKISTGAERNKILISFTKQQLKR